MAETLTETAPVTEPQAAPAAQPTSWGEDMAAMLKTPELGEPISDVNEPKVIEKAKDEEEEKPKAGVKVEENAGENAGENAKAKDVIKFPGYELDVSGKSKKERAVLQKFADDANGKKGESDSFAFVKQKLADLEGKIAAPKTEEPAKQEYFDEIDETEYPELVGMSEILAPVEGYEGKDALGKSLELTSHRGGQKGFLFTKQHMEKIGLNADLVQEVKELRGIIEELRPTVASQETTDSVELYVLKNDLEIDTDKAAIALEKNLNTEIRNWEKAEGKKFDRTQLANAEVRKTLTAKFFETYEPEKKESSETSKKAVSAKGMTGGKSPNDKTLRAPPSGRGGNGGSSPNTGHGRTTPNPAAVAERAVYSRL